MPQDGPGSPRLDIVIPVYNEAGSIIPTLEGLQRDMATPRRVLICYDRPEDDTLPVIQSRPDLMRDLSIQFVKNPGRGALSAVMAGFAASTAPSILMFPADDHTNAPQLDEMVRKAEAGADIVCASRFIPGGSMEKCPPVKAVLVRTANFTLYHVARLPTHDASNGFRLFSRRTIDRICIESDRGFCYSIELLVKAHRLGWPVAEVPVRWIERDEGVSRFRVGSWLTAYLRWYLYAFATTFLRRPASSVPMR